jgi:hypothetical protein
VIPYAKGWYQHMKATVPATVASVVTPYRPEDALRLAAGRLQGRRFESGAPLNFLMVVTVVNWEITLLEHAQRHGTCHHLDLGVQGFFDSVAEWQAWQAANIGKIREFVREHEDHSATNVLFLYLSEFHIDPVEIESLRGDNIVILNFNWDDVLHYRSSHRGQSVGVAGLAGAVDLNLSMAVTPLSRYARDGSAAFYWYGKRDPEDPDPVLPPVEYDRALFFGSCYGYRRHAMEYLLDRGIPIDLFGAGWGTEVIGYDELLHRIPRYALNLGVSTIGYARRLCQVKGRDLEVPFAGGLYLTNESREIRHVYEPGRDILTYRSLDHCYRQASAVLEHPARFAEVRANGARRARWFSWDARFRFLIELLSTVIRSW